MKVTKIKKITAVLLLLGTSMIFSAWDVQEDPQKILWQAVEENDVAAVNQILAWGADVNEPDYQGRTVLIVAVKNGFTNMVVLLLNSGANVNAKDNGNTVLMIAAQKGYLAIVEALLINGALTYLENNNGNTALEIAQQAGHKNVVNVIEDFIAKRREEVSETILKSRPETYPAITDSIAEWEIG